MFFGSVRICTGPGTNSQAVIPMKGMTSHGYNFQRNLTKLSHTMKSELKTGFSLIFIIIYFENTVVRNLSYEMIHYSHRTEHVSAGIPNALKLIVFIQAHRIFTIVGVQ